MRKRKKVMPENEGIGGLVEAPTLDGIAPESELSPLSPDAGAVPDVPSAPASDFDDTLALDPEDITVSGFNFDNLNPEGEDDPNDVNGAPSAEPESPQEGAVPNPVDANPVPASEAPCADPEPAEADPAAQEAQGEAVPLDLEDFTLSALQEPPSPEGETVLTDDLPAGSDSGPELAADPAVQEDEAVAGGPEASAAPIANSEPIGIAAVPLDLEDLTISALREHLLPEAVPAPTAVIDADLDPASAAPIADSEPAGIAAAPLDLEDLTFSALQEPPPLEGEMVLADGAPSGSDSGPELAAEPAVQEDEAVAGDPEASATAPLAPDTEPAPTDPPLSHGPTEGTLPLVQAMAGSGTWTAPSADPQPDLPAAPDKDCPTRPWIMPGADGGREVDSEDNSDYVTMQVLPFVSEAGGNVPAVMSQKGPILLLVFGDYPEIGSRATGIPYWGDGILGQMMHKALKINGFTDDETIRLAALPFDELQRMEARPILRGVAMTYVTDQVQEGRTSRVEDILSRRNSERLKKFFSEAAARCPTTLKVIAVGPVAKFTLRGMASELPANLEIVSILNPATELPRKGFNLDAWIEWASASMKTELQPI
jgi:hypothetical protein